MRHLIFDVHIPTFSEYHQILENEKMVMVSEKNEKRTLWGVNSLLTKVAEKKI